MKHKLGSRLLEIPICRYAYYLRYADDTTPMAESEEELKSLLKLNIQKTKIMAPSPITSWQIDGEIMEIVTDFIFLGSKITADDDCSLEIKRCLLLGRKVLLFATPWTVAHQVPLSMGFPRQEY